MGDVPVAAAERKALYFIKQDGVSIQSTADTTALDALMSSALSLGVINEHSLRMVEQTISLVYLPLLSASSTPIDEEFLVSLKKFGLHLRRIIQHVEGDIKLHLPPVDLESLQSTSTCLADASLIKTLEASFESWISTISTNMEHLLKREPSGPGPLPVLELWFERSSTLTALYEQLESPICKRISEILHAHVKTEVSVFDCHRAELNKLYVEAKDNVKFLSTLERHFKNITHASSFAGIKECLPSMMNALRMVWIISRHYNTDDKMVPLMERIAWQIGDRVSRRVSPKDILRCAHDGYASLFLSMLIILFFSLSNLF